MTHDQMHYSNRYASIVGFVAETERAHIGDVCEAIGITSDVVRPYLARAVARGHLWRPERGVYAATDEGSTAHPHFVCASCGQRTAINHGEPK